MVKLERRDAWRFVPGGGHSKLFDGLQEMTQSLADGLVDVITFI